MRLSKLQKYILTKCLEAKNKTEWPKNFLEFYPKAQLAKNKKSIQDIIHKSLESLTTDDLVVAYGHRTAQKWFIQKVKLTARGRKKAIAIIKSRQMKLLK